MISDEQILKAIEKEDRKIKLENLVYSLPVLVSACASQDVKDLDVSQTRKIYDQHIASISEESTPEQIDALVHKIMDANVTLEGALTKLTDEVMSDGISLLNNHEINGIDVSVRETRYLTSQGVKDVLSVYIHKSVDEHLYALFIDITRDQNRNLVYSYSEYLDYTNKQIGEKEGVKKVLYKILKTTVEVKDLENNVYADNPVNVNAEDLMGAKEKVIAKSKEMFAAVAVENKVPEKPADTNYNNTDLIMAGAIVACSLITYVVGRRFGYFGKK